MWPTPLLVMVASLLVVSTTIVGCTSAPAPDPTGFTVEYETGSIPPPFNHAYVLTGTFEDGALSVAYELTYRFREGMTEDELAERGYSEEDDVRWSGRLTGGAVDEWRALARDARLSPPPEPPPGSDSFIVTLTYTSAPTVNGVPEARDEWERRVAEIDRRAREETGNPRSEP